MYIIRILSIVFIVNIFSHHAFTQSKNIPNGWKAFSKVKFKPTEVDDFEQYLLVPVFDQKIKAFEGKKVKLKGFIMPFDYGDEPLIILSRFPYSSCFFCGGAGPETVAEVYFDQKQEGLDQRSPITVVGTLRLNSEDIDHMNFILEGSEVIED